MIDIHAHILPGIDDGSRSVAESIQMMEASARQGVECIVATPHFYAAENSPAEFLRRREHSAAALRAAWKPEFPQMALGAEVYYFEGIGHAEEIDELKLANTRFLLLEMPFLPWSERVVSEVLNLQNRRDTIVVLAHIERYRALQKPAVWRTLLDGGVKMQCNAEFFLNWRTRRRALRMLRREEIHFLASDCHNMTDRSPQLGDAFKEIDRSLGSQGREWFRREMEAFLPETIGVMR